MTNTEKTKEHDLSCACKGNGLTVYNRNKIVNGDYQTVCHISHDRFISWQIKNPNKDLVDYVSGIAKTPFVSMSASQNQNVFYI